MTARKPPWSAAVFIPVLGRPANVEPLLESLRATTTTHEVRPVFICSPNDKPQLEAVKAAGLEPLVTTWEPGRGDYARKMNLAWRETTDLYVFLAADDLRFRPDWLTHAVRRQEETGSCVIGTNDLGNRRTVEGHHSTHTLVHRNYGECGTIDRDDLLLDEGYHHVYVDDEFVQTALYRRTYSHASASIVEHLHPDWSKAPGDATYAKGRLHFGEDGQRFQIRKKMWR